MGLLEIFYFGPRSDRHYLLLEVRVVELFLFFFSICCLDHYKIKSEKGFYGDRENLQVYSLFNDFMSRIINYKFHNSSDHFETLRFQLVQILEGQTLACKQKQSCG